jgi:hypothetical protein
VARQEAEEEGEEVMKNTMIALVGGQPLPNLLPVRHYKPDHLILIYTQFTKPVYERLKMTVQPDTMVDGLETNPYNIVNIMQDITAFLGTSGSGNGLLTFNLTGGTKAMALAAYQVAQQQNAHLLYLESEGKQSRVYRYQWHQSTLQIAADELLPACITLKDFLNIHLGPKVWQEEGPNRQEGGPFEIALAEALRPHMDETMIGVKAMMGQIDIDVAVRAGNQFGIIEAKAGQNGTKLDGIKQLSTASRHLGTYTQQFYVVTVNPSHSHEAIVDASRIRVISLSDYSAETNTLSSSDRERLVAKVVKALKG